MEKTRYRGDRDKDEFFVFSFGDKILKRPLQYRTKKDLLVVNAHLVEIVNVLKDELLAKDQHIRRIKANVGNYGRFERLVIYIRNLVDRIKIRWKKLRGEYNS